MAVKSGLFGGCAAPGRNPPGGCFTTAPEGGAFSKPAAPASGFGQAPSSGFGQPAGSALGSALGAFGQTRQVGFGGPVSGAAGFANASPGGGFAPAATGSGFASATSAAGFAAAASGGGFAVLRTRWPAGSALRQKDSPLAQKARPSPGRDSQSPRMQSRGPPRPRHLPLPLVAAARLEYVDVAAEDDANNNAVAGDADGGKLKAAGFTSDVVRGAAGRRAAEVDELTSDWEEPLETLHVAAIYLKIKDVVTGVPFSSEDVEVAGVACTVEAVVSTSEGLEDATAGAAFNVDDEVNGVAFNSNDGSHVDDEW
ncbi:glycine, alanine and asparagine-rich protein-like [Selaginella moellendorffii]|uniref:glycine, alanine and asparagine-rich protein-like n=1 Tax=Selaginella moellendorffii TaxID=88036 RepID=UPI000D1C6345|nr:glycine, alanine and asparagine-rich protein-like [Selaginella moellendorffii]|eukprot:XP_024538709.1 glycine, alanine and asparagine-rich protein-like [Selaginella moellendorffii]